MNHLKKIFSIKDNTYLGSDLVDIKKVSPIDGNIASLNLLFKPKKEKISEPGVYAIFFDDSLLYIGKYQGKSKDAFGGCVNRDRWWKHLATITLRGKKVSCKATTLKNVKNESKLRNAFYDFLGDFDEDVFVGDRGCITVQPRIQFALDNWNVFKNLTSYDLARFSFHYISFAYHKETSIKKHRKTISDLEEKFIDYFNPLLNVKGKDPAKTKIVNIAQYKEFLEHNLSLSEQQSDARELSKNSKKGSDKDVYDIEDNNLYSFFEIMDSNGVNPQFIDKSISHLDSNTSLNYYFTDIPDFRISGNLGTYKNGSPIKRVLMTIKVLKKKREIKINVLMPIGSLDKSLSKLCRTINNTLPTEIAIPFIQLDTYPDLLIKVLGALKNYHDLK